MIVSFYGPDGAGKSTLMQQLQEALASRGHVVTGFGGTDVAEWPDQSWHRYFVKNRIDEGSIEEEAHFAEKIVRCYRLANDLSARFDIVLIDSDPLHKTLIHDVKRAQSKGEAPEVALPRRFAHFARLLSEAGLTISDRSIYCTLAADPAQHGEILLPRIKHRGTLAHWDPKSEAEARRLSEAAETVTTVLKASGVSLKAVFMDQPIDLPRLTDWLSPEPSRNVGTEGLEPPTSSV